MKRILSFFILLSSLSAHAQDGYPIPPKTINRLFYIQHSNNHNTFVYDAKTKDGIIPPDDALDIYRIVYTEGGIRKPLNGIQRRRAYGMNIRTLDKNSFELTLAASNKLKFYLILDNTGKPLVYITVNNRKLILDRMFVQLKDGSITPKAEWILFTGKDFTSHEPLTEKVIPKD